MTICSEELKTGMAYADWILSELIEDDDLKLRFYNLAKQYRELDDKVHNEADDMHDDYRYDHDNYDSLARELKLKDMKERMDYLNERAEEILHENGIEVGTPFHTTYLPSYY